MSRKKTALKKLKESLFKKGEIVFAYVHGSFAEGLPFRDIDVAVYVDEKAVTSQDAIDYGLEISAITEMETGLSPIDIKVINYAPVGFRYYATRGIVLFSKDEETRRTFLEDTWRRYFDLLPKRKQIILDIVSS